MAKAKQPRPRYRLRPGDQIPTQAVSIAEVMAMPEFAAGVADVRAGRPICSDYDEWSHNDKTWSYERGRQWAVLTPRNVKIKRNGSVTEEAMRWYRRHWQDIR